MRFINLIVIHCSATRCDRSYTEHDLTTDHLRRGFSGAGYHFYIRKNGDYKDAPAFGTSRCACQRLQRPQHRHLLRGRTQSLRNARRHPYRMATSFAPRTRKDFTAGLPRRPGGRTPRLEPRPERQRRSGTHGVDEAMPVL